MKNRKVAVYLSIAQFIHLLVLAFGGGLASYLINDGTNGAMISFLTAVVIGLLIGLVIVYQKVETIKSKR